MTDVRQMLKEAEDHTGRQSFDLPAALRAAHRRSRRRRISQASASISLLAALGAVISLNWAQQPEPPEPPTPARAVTPAPPPTTVVVPDVVGLSGSALDERLSSLGLQDVWKPWADVASNDAPQGTVLAQYPPAGSSLEGRRLELTFSAGGPAVDVSQIPPEAAALIAPTLMDGEKVLVVETEAGTAYKTDALLAGPCAAVRLAYRAFPDPTYGDRCY
ncbi:MAG: PASTA domain-containing protein [Actinomycetota bacterium]|nr:PASTA domain-containing protein [Actinomycetota bacterium]